MFVQLPTLILALLGATSVWAERSSPVRQNSDGALQIDPKHQHLLGLAVKVADKSNAGVQQKASTFQSDPFEIPKAQIGLITHQVSHSTPTDTLRAHHRQNKGVDVAVIDLVLGKDDTKNDSPQSIRGGNRVLQGYVDLVCESVREDAADRASQFPFFMQVAEECECGDSNPGSLFSGYYFAVCSQVNPVCIDLSGSDDNSSVQVSHIYIIPKDGDPSYVAQCAQYGLDDPNFPGQEVCSILFPSFGACLFEANGELCDSCEVCSDGSGLDVSCSGTPGTELWANTSDAQCEGPVNERFIGTPLEWYTADLCGDEGGDNGSGAGDGYQHEIVGNITAECFDEYFDIVNATDILEARETISQQLLDLDPAEYCTVNGDGLNCVIEYSSFDHDLETACSANNGQYYRNNLVIDCKDTAEGSSSTLTYEVQNIPECAGSSCSTSGIGVLAQLMMIGGYIDPLEETGYECVGSWSIEQDQGTCVVTLSQTVKCD